MSAALHIRQQPPVDGKHLIRLTLNRPGPPNQAPLEAEARIEFALTEQEHEELRWYLEDYLQRAESVEEVQVAQVEDLMRNRGEELYNKVLTGNQNTQAIWFAIREQLADLRVEITTGIAEAASIPWELMRDPQSKSPIALRVKEFVRVQSDPSISFVPAPEDEANVVRILMAICRPGREKDIALRCDANRILNELGKNRDRFEIKVLRPPTFERFQEELNDAKEKGRSYHVVHFDGHGTYADLTDPTLEDWLATMDHLRRGDNAEGKHGFLLFEHPGNKDNMRPVDGHILGQLLRDAGVPLVLLNACQSAMHEATNRPVAAGSVHDEVRAIGSLAQAVRDGEQQIEDADQAQGRDKSLGASLDYGFRHAFKEDELPIIALLHLFQGTVEIAALEIMGEGDYALPEVRGKTKEHLTGLLKRASDTGLLTQIGPAYFTIHPALPWFLSKMFARHHDGRDGRSTAQAALRAWVEAVGELGIYYHRQFNEGNRDVIQFLALEEANLLRARRSARRHGWWSRIVSAMQGLRALYDYQGRRAEWARLVSEIVPDYCTDDDEPVPGREDDYTLVMGYRVFLAQKQERDLAQAAALQDKLVALDRRQAATALALPKDAPLDDDQRNRIRTRGINVFMLGHILREQGSVSCVEAYEESIQHCRRIKDTGSEAHAHFSFGHVYKDLSDIRDLDAAETAYQRSLDGWGENDFLNRSKTIQQIGMVYHERFNEARQQCEPPETLLRHIRAAEVHYKQALALLPPSALADIGPAHGQLGNFYDDVSQTEQARDHYERAAQTFEQTGDRHGAGQTRGNMGNMYAQASGREESRERQRDLLLRAQAYAEAALRDFQHYQGRAAADEAKAQQLIDDIHQTLAQLPPE